MESTILKRKKVGLLVIAAVMIVSIFFTTENVSAASNYPTKVTGVKASATAFDRVKVSWNKKTGVTGYKIYRSVSKSSGYKLVKTVTSSKTTSWTNTGLTTNKTYYYKVKAYKKVKGKVYNSKSYSTVKSAKPVLTKPTDLTIASNAYKSVKLSWKKGTNAKGYKVYRATSSTGTYKLIKTTTSLSWTDTTIDPNKTYYYKVKSYNVRNKKYQYSALTGYKSVKTKPAAPTGVKAVSGEYSVTVKWNKVTGATKYLVYRSDGSYWTTTATSYEDLSVEPGKEYKYKVKAYGIIYGSYSSYTASAKMTETDASNYAYLNYSKTGSTTDTTKLYIGQKWTMSLNAALNGGTAVDKLLTRNNLGTNQDIYCFDTDDYDNFLIVYVKGGKVIAWRTNADILGVYKGVELVQGTAAEQYEDFMAGDSGPYIPAAEVAASNIKIGQIYFGGIIESTDTWDLKWSSDIEAEEALCEMTVNALRVMNGKDILEHNKYLYGDGSTYGAKAWSKTMAASSKVTHGVLTYGPLAGKESSERDSDVGNASEAEKSLTVWGENVGASSCGENAADGLYRSPIHSQTLMADNQLSGYEPISLHAAAAYAKGDTLYWTWLCGAYKIDYGVYAPTPVVTDVTSTTVTIEWEDTLADLGESPKYVLEYSTVEDFSSYKRVGGYTTAYTRTGLDPNTKYYFRIKAQTTIDGAVRTSDWSEIISFTTKAE